MFLRADKDNVDRSMDLWNLFACASGLHINIAKSSLVACTEADLEALGWQGRVVQRGEITCHLGYLVGMDGSLELF